MSSFFELLRNHTKVAAPSQEKTTTISWISKGNVVILECPECLKGWHLNLQTLKKTFCCRLPPHLNVRTGKPCQRANRLLNPYPSHKDCLGCGTSQKVVKVEYHGDIIKHVLKPHNYVSLAGQALLCLKGSLGAINPIY